MAKKNIEISEGAQEAIEFLKEIEKATEGYKMIFERISDDEKNLLGGAVVSIHSPLAGVGFVSMIGNNVVCKGMVANLEEDTRSGLADILSRGSLPRDLSVTKEEVKKEVN